LVASLANELLPELQIDNVDGYLLGTLQAERVEWKDDVVEVSVTELSFDWNPLCLLSTALCIGQLEANLLDIAVLIQEGGENEPEGTLPEIIMPLGISASSAKINEFNLKIGENEQKISDFVFSGSWIGSLLALESIEAVYHELKLVAEGEMDFSLPWISRFSGDLNYDVIADNDQQKTKLAFDLKGERLSFDVTGKLNVKELGGEMPANLFASVSFDQPNFPLLLSLESPMLLEESVNIDSLSADVSLRTLSAKINSKIQTPYWSESAVSIEAQWLDNALLLERADIETDNGQLSVQGKLSNAPALPFELSVSANKLALDALKLPDAPSGKAIIPYPVLIDSQIKLKGEARGDSPRIDIILSSLKGVLNHKPISAVGHLNVAHDQINVDDLLIKSGNNQIRGDGVFGISPSAEDKHSNRHALNLKLHLPEPELWLPDLRGNIEGGIQLNGLLREADIRGDLNVSDITFREHSLQLASLNFDIRKSGLQPSLLKLNMQNMTLGGVMLENTQWQLKGDIDQAELDGALKVENYGAADLHCDVSYSVSPVGHVEGVCDEFSWLSKAFSDASFAWGNKDNISVSWDVASSALGLAPFCLGSQAGEICNSELASWSPEKGYSLSLNADAISLQRLSQRWTDMFKFNGAFSAKAKISQKPGETIDADIMIALPKADFSLIKTAENNRLHRPLDITVDDLFLKASMHSDNLTLNSRFTSPQMGDIQSQLMVKNIGGKRALSGDIGIGKLDLSYLQGIVPSVETLSGLITSQLALSGDLAKPLIVGDFTLAEGKLKSDYFPETLRQINVNASFDQQTLNYQGSFESDGGKATLKGELDWQKQWILTTSLDSKAFKITPSSGIDLTIKPALSLQLKEGVVEVSGTLKIPKARVELKDLPAGAKSVSSDVRVVGRETEDISNSHWKYNTNIEIVLGRDVHFRGFGVNTYLTGNLLLSQTENGAFTGTGQVLTDDGFYTIWGQRLTVKEGRFSFSGPLDEPHLQLDATRTISGDNITVGVRVTGSASDPEVSFYSQPAMNESTVLHYLLTGQSPDQGTNSSSLLNNMVLSAGVFGSSEITEKLASKVGVSDFQVATSSDEDGTNLELSGYVSPDIYLKYGVSLYDDAKTMAMRYRLKQNLFIEAASGISSSLDVIYSFEHR